MAEQIKVFNDSFLHLAGYGMIMKIGLVSVDNPNVNCEIMFFGATIKCAVPREFIIDSKGAYLLNSGCSIWFNAIANTESNSKSFSSDGKTESYIKESMKIVQIMELKRQ